MRKVLLSVILFLFFTAAKTQVNTWENNVAKIIYDKCYNCHYNGGPGHITLETYQNVFDNAASIDYQTAVGHMPPWPPNRQYKHYQEERFLTQRELKTLHDWINDGAPSGNLANAPSPPIINKNDVITTPDLSMRISPFNVFTNSELYQCFVLPTNLTVDQFMTGLEIIPGNTEIVHHVLIYMDTTATHKARTLDANDPNPGYTNFGGVGVSSAVLIGGWVPGTRPQFYTNNFGVKIKKNSDLILQIHYPANSQNKTDSTKINLKLSSGTMREVFLAPALNHITNINAPLDIPANQKKTYTEHFKIPNPFTGFQGISALTIAPHGHLICKDWLVFAKKAIGGDTIPLIKINSWDFRWQGFYNFQSPVHLNANDELFAVANYDNTDTNPFNPSNPPQRVTAGEATTDEMMLVYFAYALYNNGDENIVFDTTNYPLIDSLGALPTGINDLDDNFISTLQLYSPVPNPVATTAIFEYYAPKAEKVTIDIVDFSGKKQQINTTNINVNPGFGKFSIDVSNFSSGNYIITVSGKNYSKSKQFLVE